MKFRASELKRDNSLVSKKILVKPSHFGELGAYAKKAIKEGEIVCIFGGRIFDKQIYAELPQELKHYAMGFDEDLFIGAYSLDEVDDADYINHSCNPNLGVVGKNILVAMRDIAKGEELSFDYAMTDTMNDPFSCACMQENCRKIIQGTDWMLPELQDRYGQFFSDYILRRIEQLQDTHIQRIPSLSFQLEQIPGEVN